MGGTRKLKPADGDRIRKALNALTREELAFFPRTDPMLGQVEGEWNKQLGRDAQAAEVTEHVDRRRDVDSAYSGIL